MAREYPKQLFHRTLAPVMVHDRKQEDALPPGYEARYIRQDYPKALYHENRPAILVSSIEEEQAKLRQGYVTTCIPEKTVVSSKSGELSISGTTMSPDTVQALQDIKFELENILKAKTEHTEDRLAALEDKMRTFEELLAPAPR